MSSLSFHLFSCLEESFQLYHRVPSFLLFPAFFFFGIWSTFYSIRHDNLTAVLCFLDLASMAMFLLRHIVMCRETVIFVVLVVCSFTPAQTSPYPDSSGYKYLNFVACWMIDPFTWRHLILKTWRCLWCRHTFYFLRSILLSC